MFFFKLDKMDLIDGLVWFLKKTDDDSNGVETSNLLIPVTGIVDRKKGM